MRDVLPARIARRKMPRDNPVVVRTRAVFGDRYELGPVLGQGGMARVYRGIDRTLQRPVAIKVLAGPYHQDRGFVQRFRREAQAAARLNHPNIVSVHDSGSDDGTHFIVMELVEGQSLGTRLKSEGPIPPAEATRIGMAVARGLAAAHERGVIHRDVKPGNVMLTEDGGVKVLDFGIAHASGAEEITRSGLVLGSALYLSPEQAQGASGDERSDLYGLGCVLYQMLTGRPPFVADDPMASLYQHVNGRPAPPSSIRPVPEDLERIVLRCLEKDPASRFASASELESALGAASEPPSTMPLSPVAGGATVPVRRAAGEATVPVSLGAGVATKDVVAEAPVSHHARPSRRSWRIAGLAAGILLVAGAVLVLANPGRLPMSAELREMRQEARAGADTPQPSPTVDEARTVGEASDRLIDVILAAQTAAEIFDDDVAAELLDDAREVKEAHAAGDAEWFQIEYPDLINEIETARERGEVSDAAGASIGEALDDLIVAIGNDPLESPSPNQGDEDDDD
jgi:eukaryotic-like serine/threonine-protein kinase